MSESSGQAAERSRKYYALVRQQLVSGGRRAVAEGMGCNESTISRMKSGGAIERLCKLEALLGEKFVPESINCYRPEDIDPYIPLARQHMNTIWPAEKLVWEDPE